MAYLIDTDIMVDVPAETSTRRTMSIPWQGQTQCGGH
jgi:hypothetical protein